MQPHRLAAASMPEPAQSPLLDAATARKVVARTWLYRTSIAVAAIAALIVLHEILIFSPAPGKGPLAEIHAGIHIGLVVLLVPLLITVAALWRAQRALNRYGDALHAA